MSEAAQPEKRPMDGRQRVLIATFEINSAVLPSGHRGHPSAAVEPASRGRIADHLIRLDYVVLDELGNLPFAHSKLKDRSPPSANVP